MKKILTILAILFSINAMAQQHGVDAVYKSVQANNDAYGGMSFADSSSVLGLTQNNWKHITNGAGNLFTIDTLENMTYSKDSMTVLRPGIYHIDLHFSFSGTNGDNYEMVVAVNGDNCTNHKVRRKVNNGSVRPISLSGIHSLSVGDDVKVRVRNIANNNDITLVNGCVNIIKIK